MSGARSHQGKCGFSEERLALFVEDDVAPAERGEIETHLAQCAECREFAAELQESQTIFKSIREDIVTPLALTEVRGRVLAGIESSWMLRLERLLFAGLRWRYALAGLVFVLMVSALYQRLSPPDTGGVPEPTSHQAREGRSVATPPPALTSPAAPDKAPTQPPLLSQEGNKRPRMRKPQPAPAVAQPAKEPRQVLVKLLTDDPNIVIYWLIDEKNGGEE